MRLKENNPGWDTQIARIRESGDAVLIEAVRSGQISVKSAAVVAMLAGEGCYGVADVAEKFEREPETSKRQHSSDVRKLMSDLERRGWLRRVNDEKRVCWATVSH